MRQLQKCQKKNLNYYVKNTSFSSVRLQTKAVNYIQHNDFEVQVWQIDLWSTRVLKQSIKRIYIKSSYMIQNKREYYMYKLNIYHFCKLFAMILSPLLVMAKRESGHDTDGTANYLLGNVLLHMAASQFRVLVLRSLLTSRKFVPIHLTYKHTHIGPSIGNNHS